MSDKTTIVIAESIPAFNLGEQAIMRGIVSVLRQIQGCHIVYCTEYYDEDARVYGGLVDAWRVEYRFGGWFGKLLKHVLKAMYLNGFALLNLLTPRSLVRKVFPGYIIDYLEADVLLVGHDNLYVNPSRVFADFGIILFSKLTRKRLVSFGSSIGPYRVSGPRKWALRRILNQFDAIVLREYRSERELDDLGVSRPDVSVVGDAAFLMEGVVDELNQGLIDEVREKRCQGSRYVAVALSRSIVKYFFDVGVGCDQKEALLVKELAGVLRELADTYKVTYLFVDHVAGAEKGDYHDDGILHDKIIKQLGGLDVRRVVGFELGAERVKALFSEMDVLLASRTHAMIAGVSVGASVVGLSFQGNYKTEGIIGTMFDLKDQIINMSGSSAEIQDLLKSALSRALAEAPQNKERLLHESNRLKKNVRDAVQCIFPSP